MTTTTLTWASSGNGVRTNVGSQVAVDLINNLATLIGTFSGNAAFSWQVAGKVVTGSIFYLLLSRKDASAGRIAIIYYVSTPAGYNPTIMDTIGQSDIFYTAFFPSGTGTTLSNLAGSGTMCGVDTNAVKVSNSYDQNDLYAANNVPFYFDSYDGCYFCFGNPASSSVYMLGAGALFEDTLTSTAVNATVGGFYGALAGMGALGSTANPFGGWTSGTTLAGAASGGCRANYPNAAVSKQFYNAFGNNWCSTTSSDVNDILSDPTNNKYFYVPVFLLSNTKGEGIVLKVRQVGYGSGETYPYATRYTTVGGVATAQSRMMCNLTAGGTGYPWLTNFKI